MWSLAGWCVKGPKRVGIDVRATGAVRWMHDWELVGDSSTYLLKVTRIIHRVWENDSSGTCKGVSSVQFSSAGGQFQLRFEAKVE